MIKETRTLLNEQQIAISQISRYFSDVQELRRWLKMTLPQHNSKHHRRYPTPN
ncbi:hypothetical protein [Nocardia sp. CC227C]|uniref:hypothetical protein n=1 Tax=Nocardia sp. CC227C TaxID=3044562 RepID=UPI00278C6860|nr:hypothetical protein [Nocardia sp. CC227C]